MKGRGDGRFWNAVYFPADQPTTVEIKDWDFDGRLDLAATSPYSHALTVYRTAGACLP